MAEILLRRRTVLELMHVDMVGMGMKDLMGMKCGIMREKVVRGMEYG